MTRVRAHTRRQGTTLTQVRAHNRSNLTSTIKKMKKGARRSKMPLAPGLERHLRRRMNADERLARRMHLSKTRLMKA